jgi:tetratricopeptide (TPR) repeat protein
MTIPVYPPPLPITAAGDPSFELCLKADPYWISTINSYALPLRLIEPLAEPYRRLAAVAAQALTRSDFDAAHSAARQAMTTGISDHGFAQHLLALIAFSRRHDNSALADLRLSLGEAPDCAEYQNNFGVACVKTGQIAEAVGAFEAAAALAPNYGHPFAALAVLYTLARQWPKAESAAHTAIRLGATRRPNLAYLCLMSATLEQGKRPEGAFSFDSLAAGADTDIVSALGYLPPIDLNQFSYAPAGQYTIFLPCDREYFWTHAIPLVWSLAKAHCNASIHLHLGNADDEVRAAVAQMRQRIDLPLHASFELVDPDRYGGKKVYFSSARFCRLYQYLVATRRPTLMLDVDRLCRRDPWPEITAAGLTDMGLCRVEEQPPWARVMGGIVAARPTPGSEEFLRRATVFIVDNFRRNTQNWFLDQVGLYAVWRQMKDRLRFTDLPAPIMSDRRFGEASALWSVVNELKHQDNRYNDFKTMLMHEYGDLRRS